MSAPAPAGITDVLSRINQIQQRFAPQAGFAAVLAEATAPPPGAADAPLPAVTAPARGAARPMAAASVAVGAASATSPDWASRLPEAGRAWAPAITAAAESAGVEPRLLAALVWAESGFRPDAGSHAGAIGLAQLMPATARGLGVDPHDPASNLLGGARYLRAQLDRFGSPELALAAYNAGPSRVARAGGIPQIPETQAYVPRVLDYHARLQ